MARCNGRVVLDKMFSSLGPKPIQGASRGRTPTVLDDALGAEAGTLEAGTPEAPAAGKLPTSAGGITSGVPDLGV